MELLIPQITLETLTESERERYIALDQRPYGKQLAHSVATKLTRNPTESGGLYFSHRDYCGMGLYIYDGKFTLGAVNDGRGPFPIVAIFEFEADFVQWLANASDQSMALYGDNFNNQTLTKLRLEWYLEADYSSIWNAFCEYNGRRIEKEAK